MSSGTLTGDSATLLRTEDAGRIGRNITALAGGQLVTWSMTLLWTLVVPRALGPAGLGVVVSAMSVSGVLGIVLGLGTRNYLVREMVVDPPGASRLLGTALALRLSVAPLFAVAVIVYAQLAHYSHEGTIVLYLVATATFLTLLAEPMQAGFQAIERMKYLAYSDVINKTALSFLGIGIVLVGLRAVGIAASMAGVAAAIIVLNATWIRGFIRPDLRTTAAQLRSMVRESIAYWAFAVFTMVYLWIDTIMLSLMTRPEVVGWYGAPVRLFQTLMFLPVLLSTAWLPRLVSAFGEGEQRLRAVARQPVELVLVLSLPIAAGAATVAGPMVRVLYGSEYSKAVPVMIVLGLCLAPMYLNIMLASVLIAAKRQMTWTWVMVAAVIVNPPINLVLIPWTQHRYGNGAIGAAISLLLTELVLVTCGLLITGSDIFDRRSVRRCVLAALASASMWAVAYSTRTLGELPSIALGAATFLALVVVLRIATPEEIEFLRGRLRRLRRARTA